MPAADVRKLKTLMRTTCGKMQGLLAFRRGEANPWALSYCYMRQVWDYLKRVADYEEKRAAVDEYNHGNKWRKRGLGMIPVKYGSGYNLLMLEQACAVISINQGDGSIFIHQGGVEMGQRHAAPRI